MTLKILFRTLSGYGPGPEVTRKTNLSMIDVISIIQISRTKP
jgi:hypothetical protein